MIVRTRQHIALYRQTWFCLFAVSILCLAALQLAFVVRTVYNTGARERRAEDAAALTARLAELEARRLSIEKDITLSRAASYGFTENIPTSFAARTPVEKTALAHNEI